MKNLSKNLAKTGGIIASLVGILAISAPVQALSIYASGFNNPTGIAFDSSGNLFVANSFTNITQVTPSGTRSTFATGLNNPAGLAFNLSGNLFATDTGNNKVLGFNSSGGVIRTFASNATTTFNNPRNIAFSSSSDNSVFITSSNSGKIIFFSDNSPNGIEEILLTPVSVPFGIVIDLQGGNVLGAPGKTKDLIYVTDIGGVSKTVKRISNIGVADRFSDGGLTFGTPLGLALDPVSKNLYISDIDNNTITQLDPFTGVSSVLVSSGLNQPGFITVSGNSLYISDNGSGNILRLELSQGATAVPFEFSPTLGLVVVGGVVVARKLSKKLRKK